MAKALFERQSVPVHLTIPLFKHLVALPVTLADLEHVDRELHKNLMWIVEHECVGARGGGGGLQAASDAVAAAAAAGWRTCAWTSP